MWIFFAAAAHLMYFMIGAIVSALLTMFLLVTVAAPILGLIFISTNISSSLALTIVQWIFITTTIGGGFGGVYWAFRNSD